MLETTSNRESTETPVCGGRSFYNVGRETLRVEPWGEENSVRVRVSLGPPRTTTALGALVATLPTAASAGVVLKAAPARARG